MSAWILGIDAGGTRTRVALATPDGKTLRDAAAGPCNWTTLPAETCLAHLDEAVGALLPPGDEVAAACVCSAGYFAAHHQESVTAALRERWPGAALRLETDLVAAWAGALGAEPGVVLVAGTGSVAYGRLADGREARSGGWGPLFGDEGSAYWLACQALRAVAKASDGRGRDTELFHHFRRALDLGPESPELWLRELLRQQPDRERIAALAPAVLAAHAAGDPEATSWFHGTAITLAKTAHAVETQLSPVAPLPWSWTGGLLQGSEELRRLIGTVLEAMGSSLRMTAPRTSGERGALLLAEGLLGQTRLRGRLLDADADER